MRTTRSTTGTPNFKSRRRRASARRRAFHKRLRAEMERRKSLALAGLQANERGLRRSTRQRSKPLSTGAAKPRCTNACTVRCPPSRRSSVAPPTRCGRERLRAGRRNRFASPASSGGDFAPDWRRTPRSVAVGSAAACDTVWCRRRRTPRTPPRRGPKSTASTPCRRASMTRPVAVCR